LLEGKVAKYAVAFTAMYMAVLVFFDARFRTPVPLVLSKIESKKAYLSGFTLSGKDYHQSDKRKLPATILNEIGNQTVDVFPWDAAFVLENKLNYAPRPVFQSFSAYTPYLAMLNYQHYLQHAPAYVLYDYASIDERYPFADDCETQLLLAKNYIVADTFYSNERHMLLLKKKEGAIKPLVEVVSNTSTVAANELIDVSEAGFVKIDMQPTGAAKLTQLLKRQAPVYISMYLSSGDSITYKTSAMQLASGIYTARFIKDVHAFEMLCSDSAGVRINKLKVEARYPVKGGMKVSYCDIR
jgi:hypothetical protein